MVTEGKTAAGARHPLRLVALMAPLLGLIAWVYWPTLRALGDRWSDDSRYSHGFLVPAFSLFLLWHRRGMIELASPRPSWWGLPLILAGVGLRLGGMYIYFEWLEGISLLPCLCGLSLLLGGRAALRWAWPAIVFLAFMIPLPHRLEVSLGLPLQQVATKVGVYVLQTLGLPAFAEGTIIHVGEARIGVVEACNGLGMLVMFFSVATAVAMVSRRPLLDRALIILGAIPIALIANLGRITVTALLYVLSRGRLAEVVYHDLSGWLMMPAALGLLWVELRALSLLLIEPTPGLAIPIPSRGGAAGPRRRAAGSPGPQDPPASRPPRRD